MNCWIIRKRMAALSLTATMLSASAFAVSAQEVTWPSFHWGESIPSQIYGELAETVGERNPDITVDGIAIPFGTFWDKQFLEISTGNPADVATMFDPEIRAFVNSGVLIPLNDYLTAKGYSAEDFNPAINYAMKDGNIYAIPLVTNARQLIYNAKMFEDAGLEPPTDFDKFMTALRALRDESEGQFGFATATTPGSPQGMFFEHAPIIFGFGGAYFEDGVPTVTKPETIAALEFLKEIYDEGLIPKGTDTATYRNMLHEGKVAMYVGGAYMVARAPEEIRGDLRTVELPFLGGETGAINVFLGIPEGAKQADAAAEVLMTMLEDDFQYKWMEVSNEIPGRKIPVHDSWIEANPWMQPFLDGAADPDTQPFTFNGAEDAAPEIIKIIGSNLEAMFSGGVSAQKVADLTQRQLEDFMASR